MSNRRRHGATHNTYYALIFFFFFSRFFFLYERHTHTAQKRAKSLWKRLKSLISLLSGTFPLNHRPASRSNYFVFFFLASASSGLCYSELASRFPVGGPAYAYVYATLGELPAFLVGWAMVFEYLVGSALAAKALTQYLDVISNHTIASALNVQQSSILGRVPGFEPGIDLSSGLFVLLVTLLLLRNLKVSSVRFIARQVHRGKIREAKAGIKEKGRNRRIRRSRRDT